MIGVTSIILILAALGICQTPPPASQFEVPCPSNTSPLPPNGWTLDPSTGKYRAWACVDVNGAVTVIGAGTPPGGADGEIQFNDGGTFNGIPSSNADGTLGLLSLQGNDGASDTISIAPGNFGVGSPTANFFWDGAFTTPTAGFNTTAVTFDMSVNTTPSLVPITIKGDGIGNDMLDLIPNGTSIPAASFDTSGVLHVPSCVGCGGGALATVDLVNQNTSLGPTTIYTPSVAGLYKISFYMNQSAACRIAGPGEVTLDFTWSDATSTGITTSSDFFILALTPALPNNSALVPTVTSINIFSVAGQPIQYETVFTACSIGSATYDLYLVLN
jgi:hypothetical protein